jgi:hypothetical protein
MLTQWGKKMTSPGNRRFQIVTFAAGRFGDYRAGDASHLAAAGGSRRRGRAIFRFLVAFQLVFEFQARPLIGVGDPEVCPAKATIRRGLWHKLGAIAIQ